MSVSRIILNGQMAKYGDMAVAGYGVAMKITMITGMICIGFGQGIQPLLVYCVGAFLSNPKALSLGIEFSRIMLTTSFLFGMFYVLSNALQAMGAATSALIINMSRQGIIYIPAIFIF